MFNNCVLFVKIASHMRWSSTRADVVVGHFFDFGPEQPNCGRACVAMAADDLLVCSLLTAQ